MANLNVEVSVYNGPYRRADRIPKDELVIWDGEICVVKRAEFVDNGVRVKVWLEIQYPNEPQEIITTVNVKYEFQTVVVRVDQ